MKNYTSTYLTALSIAATLGTAIAVAEPTHAATVTYQFEANLIESLFLTGAPEIELEPNPDLYTGRFSFDDAALTGVGFESLGAEAGLEVSLFDDPRVNQEVDARFPEFPTVNFQDGELIGLDWFAVYHPFTNVPELDYPGDFVRISGTDLTDGFDPTFYTPEEEPRNPVLGFGTVEYSQVPEPGTVLSLAILALGSGLAVRKRYA
ncbi:MAG: PEP-CTERM sorting domain-containing protein [Cyanobacteria bacterium J06559_3]